MRLSVDTPARTEGARPPQEVPLADVFLYAGQVYVSKERRIVLTILGSCVATCLWDCGGRGGGLNHYALPDAALEGASARHGPEAFRILMERLRAVGCRKEDLAAKVFGGASLGMPSAEAGHGLGERNVALARHLLELNEIRIEAVDVGGSYGRKLLFDTQQGTAWVETLGGLNHGTR